MNRNSRKQYLYYFFEMLVIGAQLFFDICINHIV